MSQPPSIHKLDPTRYRPSYYVSRDRNLESFVDAAFNTAMDYFARQEWDKAAAAFARCVEYRPDFVEAYIWLARLTPDPVKQRDHLTSALAYEPTHGEALRDLMILNGELTYDDKLDEYGRPQLRRVEGVAASKTENLRCPRCASTRLVDDDSAGAGALGGELYCESCGYRMPKPGASIGYDSLAMANLKRRAQAVRWRVGSRVLHCDSCGAERTIPATKLAEGCPFCGSRNVIEQDALGSFQQPDGIIPFSVSEKSALELVEAQLKGWSERIKGWVSDNRVKRTAISGVYLPFWVFDVVFEVTRTTYDVRSPDVTFNPVIAQQTETFADMKPNVLMPGVTQPPRALTRRLVPYKVSKAVAYQPRMLAQHAAELYSVDVDAAALLVHEIISEGARQKYSRPATNPQVTTYVSTMVKNVTFQLLLLPAWSITLFERDGDVRPALVNGQTGRVALGRAQKPG
jgi:DNA-directed RNA polymerase subunit RPC12/RpoP